jgi:hypothetical protein
MTTILPARPLFSALLGLTLLACGGGSSPPPPPPPPTTGSLQLTNGAALPINEVYVSLSTSTTWGAVRNSTAIAPSAVWTLDGLAPGTYDAAATINGAVGTYYAYLMGFPIVAGVTYPVTAVTGDFTGSLRVVNGATSTITELYVSLPSDPTWGPNQLVAAIPLSGVVVMNDVAPGPWDVLCVHADASSNTFLSVTIASLGYATVTCL